MSVPDILKVILVAVLLNCLEMAVLVLLALIRERNLAEENNLYVDIQKRKGGKRERGTTWGEKIVSALTNTPYILITWYA